MAAILLLLLTPVSWHNHNLEGSSSIACMVYCYSAKNDARKGNSSSVVGAGVSPVIRVEAGVIERCNGAVVELVPCADSIKGKGSDPVSHGCCMALSELLLSPECLCYAATTAQGFDMKQILGLPAACKYHVKPHQTCEGIPIPSYSKPPPEDQHTPGDEAEDLPPLGFSDEVREDIRKEFRAHQARLDSLSP